MPVVINEFEVVPGESKPPQSSGSSASGESQEKEAPSPREIEMMVEQQLERCNRVWAH